ncbi:MAG: hypothetical protein IIB69_07495 [Proteobacteria bacterium]|nr:hypothetical protein [Pseudomonadota bacterium]
MDTRILTYRYRILRRAARPSCLLLTLTLMGALFFPALSVASESFRILSQNMYRLFDDIDDGKGEKVVSEKKFRHRVDTAAGKITGQFRLPDIIALQEVENLNVLDRISKKIFSISGIKYYSIIREGNDISGINIGYLMHPKFEINTIRQLFKHDLLPYDQTPLFSRPPLYLRACFESSCLSLLNLHLRSMRGLRSASRNKRVSLKRLAQATAIARWIDDFQRSRPKESLLVLGDFNALTPTDSFVDMAGTIRGDPDNSKTSLAAKDWIEEDLIDLTRNIPQRRRYSYIYRKKKQILDYMLVNARFKPQLRNIAFSRIDYKFSDHAALIAEFSW